MLGFNVRKHVVSIVAKCLHMFVKKLIISFIDYERRNKPSHIYVQLHHTTGNRKLPKTSSTNQGIN